MNIITISREFGSGGRELGRRLADILECDYYDREIIETIAENTGMDKGYISDALENHGWRSIPLTFGHSFTSPLAAQYAQTGLLIEQKRVIEEIAELGKDFIIVGRNADVLLKDYCPFNIFVCADMQAKIHRCMERAAQSEKLSAKEMKRKMQNIDKNRAHTREIITGLRWGERHNYHLTLNTTDWSIKELAPAAAGFAESWFGRTK